MAVVVSVSGLAELRRAVKAVSGDMDKELSKALRASVGPIVADARSRFEALGGSGARRTAKQVRGSAAQRAVSVTLTGNHGFEFGKEFGSKGPKTSTFSQRRGTGATQVTRTINYANPHIFGPWTGNRFTLPPGRSSGHAFFPAAALGAGKAVDRVWEVLGTFTERMANG